MKPRPPSRAGLGGRLARSLAARAPLLSRSLAAAAPLLALACAAPPPPRVPLLPLARLADPDAPALAASQARYDFFEPPAARDPWTARIARWQLRQAAARREGLLPAFPTPPATPLAVGSGAPGAVADGASVSLAARYDDFMSERRREIARRVLDWVQAEARTRFVEDGPIDQWPTLPEVLRRQADDCDGLELLAFHALRELGFPEDRVYRAILRSGIGQHHMVTLWFEDLRDPWVLDPTATITSHLRRLSEIRDWVPLKVFSETREFTVSAR